MSSIVAGRFASIPEAEEVARKLYARGFSVWDVSVMSVNPGGARPPGVLLAAHAKRDRREEVADVLREGGALDLEKASGKWDGGQWTDFDPHRPPALIDEEPAGECWPAPVSARHDDSASRPPHAGPVAAEAVAMESTGNEDPGSELEHYVDKQIGSHG